MNVSKFLKELKKSAKVPQQHDEDGGDALIAPGAAPANGGPFPAPDLSEDDSEGESEDKEEAVTWGRKRQRFDGFGRAGGGRIGPREAYEPLQTFQTNGASAGGRAAFAPRRRVAPRASVDALRAELLQRRERLQRRSGDAEGAPSDTERASRSEKSAGVQELLVAVEDLLTEEHPDAHKVVPSFSGELPDSKPAELLPEVPVKAEVVKDPMPEVDRPAVVEKKSLFARAKSLTSGVGGSATKEGEYLHTKKFKR